MDYTFRLLLVRAGYLIVLILLVSIAFYAVHIYKSLNQQDPAEGLLISEDLKETVGEYRDSFWVDGNDLETYRITKEKASEIVARNKTKAQLTEIELNDEMLMMTNYAASARNVYPEEGLRAFAQIYNDDRYSRRIRANALLHVMFYPVEMLDTPNLSIQNVNDWIYAEDLFSSVLVGTRYEGIYLDNERDIFEASVIGLRKASEVSDSKSLSAKIDSLRFDLQLNLLIQDLLRGRSVDIWKHLGTETWSAEDLLPIKNMFGRYDAVQESVLSGFDSDDIYNDEYSHAAKNILRSYTTMLAFGIDTADQIKNLNEASVRYLESFESNASLADLKKQKSYAGVNALYMGCSYIIENGYSLEDQNDLDEVSSLFQPFLNLSHDDIRIFLVTAALGQREEGACFQPFVIFGQKNEAFKEALIYGVGGWKESQFE